jgi:anti-repressor protein
MSELKIFEGGEFGQVRIVMEEGNPWFVAKDIVKALDYSEQSQGQLSVILKAVPEEWKGRRQVSTLQSKQYLTVLSEQGLYFFLGRSEKPKALPYQKMVAGEIMPSIRKHGAYLTPDTIQEVIRNPDTLLILVKELQQEQEARKLAESKLAMAEEKIEIDKPKVEVAEALDSAAETLTVGEASKIIQQAGYTEHGQNFLYGFLRENGFVMKVGCAPTQRAIKAGWLKEHVTFWEDRQGATHPTISSRVTGKGMSYLLDVFRKRHDAEQAREQHQGSLVERKKRPFSLKKLTEEEYRQLQ